MKLYNFGADVRGRQPDTYKPIAWPINVWACYIPDNVNPKLNILEKLILSLVGKGLARTDREIKDILVKQIGMNSDLIDNVLADCKKDYFDKRHGTELVLNTHAKTLLEAIDGEITPEMQMSDLTKKVYLIQDAVTNTVVPCFSVDTLPEDGDYELIEDQNCISLQAIDSSQPKTAAITNALRHWGKIRKAIDSGELSQENQVDMETEPSDFEDEDFILDENPVKALSESTDKPKQISSITVYDDEPKSYFAIAYVAFNPSNPTEIEIISPLGKVYDNWFMKLVNRLRVYDKSFTEELQLFLMERTELFKDRIAFGNDMEIQLFDDFPLICNSPAYADLKKAIRDLSKDVVRFRQGDDETTNFAKNLRTAIEVIFRTAINAHPEIKAQKKDYCGFEKDKTAFQQDFNRYKLKIRQVVETNRLNADIKQRYSTQGIYKNMADPRSSNPKDNAALILLYASKTPANFATQFVIDYDHVFIDMYDLYHLGTDAGHAGANFTTMNFSLHNVETYYSQYENIVRALFSCFIEGEK